MQRKSEETFWGNRSYTPEEFEIPQATLDKQLGPEFLSTRPGPSDTGYGSADNMKIKALAFEKYEKFNTTDNMKRLNTVDNSKTKDPLIPSISSSNNDLQNHSISNIGFIQDLKDSNLKNLKDSMNNNNISLNQEAYQNLNPNHHLNQCIEIKRTKC
ncbi:11722_t:CDS:2 [Diversispora eburnea]|uniref:11722_t:CDS:1 n=1 Tax=Diversispora eburnea TaxID=1213867 RepID=A0A9N8ZQU0_9GLOM|nr:11722_t:CDS:2 [Diversispora eburnea]